MADAIEGVLLKVFIQENGIIRLNDTGKFLGRLDDVSFEELKPFAIKTDRKEEDISSQIELHKEKEILLENGTLVIIKSDESKRPHKILWSIPDDVYGHRYCVEGWSFMCEKRDIIVPD